MILSNTERAKRARTETRPGGQFRQEVPKLSERWGRITSDEKSPYERQARHAAQGLCTVDASRLVIDLTRTCNLGLASPSSPLVLEHFGAEVKDLLHTPDSQPLPGALQYCGHLRQCARERLFIKDKGDIPAKQTFREVLPCWRAHPGDCRHDDSFMYECIIDAAEGIFDLVKYLQVGTSSWFQCIGSQQVVAACLSHMWRGANTVGDRDGGPTWAGVIFASAIMHHNRCNGPKAHLPFPNPT